MAEKQTAKKATRKTVKKTAEKTVKKTPKKTARKTVKKTAQETDQKTANFLSALRTRGLVHQTSDDETDERPLEKLLAAKRVTGYIGFDPTASSLTIGNLVQIMLLARFQKAGHRPIALVGGGTGMVGDPSGKTEMRRVLSPEELQTNLEAQTAQIGRYLDLAPEPDAGAAQGFVINNADWLLDLNYVEFLREVGRHFSINRMLAAESVQQRLESDAGISFLEFNYSILQAYDFLVLSRRYDCELQMGGSDQWGNIVAGIELVRRSDAKKVHAVTSPLLTTSSGQKMGKTEKGSVWLDPERTSPYDFYQYWINTDDRDVGRCLRVFTFLPDEEITELEKLAGADIRKAKQVLAFEATHLTHGEEEAKKAEAGARKLFGGDAPGLTIPLTPTHAVPKAKLEAGILIAELCADSRLTESRNAARRLAKQGGLYVNGTSVPEDYVVTQKDLKPGVGEDEIVLRAGKKKFMRVVVDYP